MTLPGLPWSRVHLPSITFCLRVPKACRRVRSNANYACEQEFLPWAKLTTRIWKGAEHIQSEWTAGPIPFEDGLGKELVVRTPSFVPTYTVLHALKCTNFLGCTRQIVNGHLHQSTGFCIK